jgi:hypothetical protein
MFFIYFIPALFNSLLHGVELGAVGCYSSALTTRARGLFTKENNNYLKTLLLWKAVYIDDFL